MQGGILRRYASPLAALLRLVDVTAVALLGWAAYFVRFGIHALPPAYYVAVTLGTALLAAILFPAVGLYRETSARFAKGPGRFLEADCCSDMVRNTAFPVSRSPRKRMFDVFLQAGPCET